MALLHHRDAPVAYLLLGLGQPIVDGGKLLMKTMGVQHKLEEAQQRALRGARKRLS